MKRVVVIGAIAVILAVTGAFIVLNRKDTTSSNKTPQIALKTVQTQEFKLEHNELVRQEQLSEEDSSTNILGRFTNTDPTTPVLITVKKESGLRLPARVAKLETMEMLLENLERSYPVRYPGFKEVSRSENEINGLKTAQVIFTYNSTTNELAQQRLYIVVKDSDTAYYLSAQARASQFGVANSSTFDTVFSSFELL